MLSFDGRMIRIRQVGHLAPDSLCTVPARSMQQQKNTPCTDSSEAPFSHQPANGLPSIFNYSHIQ